jgi:hypothetical protein
LTLADVILWTVNEYVWVWADIGTNLCSNALSAFFQSTLFILAKTSMSRHVSIDVSRHVIAFIAKLVAALAEWLGGRCYWWW